MCPVMIHARRTFTRPRDVSDPASTSRRAKARSAAAFAMRCHFVIMAISATSFPTSAPARAHRRRLASGKTATIQVRKPYIHSITYLVKILRQQKKISSISFPKMHDIFLASSSENFVLPSSFLLYAAFVPKPKSFAMSSHVNPFSLRSSLNRSNILVPPFFVSF